MSDIDDHEWKAYSELIKLTTTIDALCARHDIDIDGIVRAIDAMARFGWLNSVAGGES